MNANQRTSLYILVGAIATALTVWKVLTEDQAAALVAVATGAITVWGSFVAVKNVTPDEVEDSELVESLADPEPEV